MPDAPVKISVVVPVRDMGDSLGACLTALTRQSVVPHEILVVDNGSQDNTAEVIRSFPVTYLFEQRPGAAAARNCGIRAATGEVVAFTDADCVAAQSWVGALAAPFAGPEVQVVAGTPLPMRDVTPLIATYATLIGQLDPKATLSHPRFPYAPTSCVAVRRSALDRVRGGDPTYRTYEGADLFYRMHREGLLSWRIAPRAVVFFRTRSDLRAFIRQNYRYGQGYGQFCRRYRDDVGAERISILSLCRRWKNRVSSGGAQLAKDAPNREMKRRLLALHLARETALLFGALTAPPIGPEPAV